MAKNDDTITIEVKPDNLGVLARHDLLMQTDQGYRDEALRPPGGLAPGESNGAGEKEEDPVPDEPNVPAGAVAAALSTESRGAQS